MFDDTSSYSLTLSRIHLHLPIAFAISYLWPYCTHQSSVLANPARELAISLSNLTNQLSKLAKLPGNSFIQ